jgi:endonuclease YncB( thermonuclease family)
MQTMPLRTLIAGLILIALPSSQGLAANATVRDGSTLQLGNMTYRLDGIDAPPMDQLCIDEHAEGWTRVLGWLQGYLEA